MLVVPERMDFLLDLPQVSLVERQGLWDWSLCWEPNRHAGIQLIGEVSYVISSVDHEEVSELAIVSISAGKGLTGRDTPLEWSVSQMRLVRVPTTVPMIELKACIPVTFEMEVVPVSMSMSMFILS